MAGSSYPTRSSSVVGLQWGDEGKGKLVDRFAGDHDAVVRYNGGANAGHSVVVGDARFALHVVPSGILYPGKLAVVGSGVVVDPEGVIGELDGLIERGVDVSGFVLSDRAHVVMPYHKVEDELREEMLMRAVEREGVGFGQIGTTKRGIGPCYAEKVQRSLAVRVGELLDPDHLRVKVARACELKSAMLRPISEELADFDPQAMTEMLLACGERLRPSITDTTYLLHELARDGKRILFEGANATLLDVDHGTYPFVTSSSTTALGIGPGTGLPDTVVGSVTGVMKAYTTRVGAGPMPTELHDAVGERIRERGREYGTTTGRPRRCGWLDLVAVRYAAMVTGATSLALTMLDVLSGFEELRVCTAYDVDGEITERFLPDATRLDRAEACLESVAGWSEDITGAESLGELPAAARTYLDRIADFVGVPIGVVSVGPERDQTIVV